MAKIRSLDVVGTIAIILLLVIAEQANAITVDADCIGPCTSNCQQLCISKGYKDWTCASFRTKVSCCCKPRKQQIFEQPALLNN
ncbi:PREDICTED: defensin-like protein 75 [Camelina sativa]|uniref:Defensin-like protein 75 n=1 Tax=Camelina sativa TaxID=90675 RepID=A0ABM1QG91_CAMSA|nr:PREDICTED: defensin-like protein 75 [Camelina sativa]